MTLNTVQQERKPQMPGWPNGIDPFYSSKPWRKLRYQVLLKYSGKCQCCGSRGPLNVDHIKPRRKYPELEMEISNLQVLCADCNAGKGDDETDWRNVE